MLRTDEQILNFSCVAHFNTLFIIQLF